MQHDLTIANQGFPAFRADLNSALQALGSCQSGTSAPSPTFANQLWYDTTNNILKIRNEDNDAWISIATLDQTADSVSAITATTLNGTTVNAGALNATGNTVLGDASTDTLNVGNGDLVKDSSGNLGIGSSSPDPFFSSNTRMVSISSSGGGTSSALNITSGSGSRIQLGVSTTRTALLYSDNSNYTALQTTTALPLVFGTNDTERLRIPADAAGIQFPATQVASSNANTLDDYEEGTWTPNAFNNGSSSTWTVKIGRYTKVGNLVTCWFNCDGGNSGTAGGAIILSGLPFSDIGNGNWQVLGMVTSNGYAAAPVMMQGSGGNAAQIWTSGAGQDTAQRSYISGMFTYRS